MRVRVGSRAQEQNLVKMELGPEVEEEKCEEEVISEEKVVDEVEVSPEKATEEEKVGDQCKKSSMNFNQKLILPIGSLLIDRPDFEPNAAELHE